MFYRFIRMLVNFIYTILFRLKTEGTENIPATGPVILCANHISVLDPPTVGIRIKRPVKFMAKEELFAKPILGVIIRNLGAFPVKRGGVSKESIKHTLTILREGNVLGIFPEGTTKGTTGGMGKKGVASFALKTGAAVVPVAIIGKYKLFQQVVVKYGKPVDLSEFDSGSSEDLELATEKIMAVIRAMIAEHQRK
ncbi:1-acyl-sn-glycerol-3-phosphate acyltransferase [Paenibacillus albiflavus]|uniref:1-acyl-sn-glycerol-3-phosphate acyltransferase n=1 Tax=Paenibacillus albiflavus TaxID=2545760 RepID=A0A4R4ERQ5_9BACL|nr:lysophospholipid acyltransferase family protein [Paenibacillus albiflavus]TCZ81235.1 1-acyl-sn-glycerol-3-phosphate acyltransferase [Paenibacillus albiflavus]